MASSFAAAKPGLEARLRELRCDDLRYPILRAHVDFLDGDEARAAADFRTYLEAARLGIASDRSLWNDVCEAAFCMREFAALEKFLLYQHHVPIHLVYGREEEPHRVFPILWSLEATGASVFRFSDRLDDHPDAPILVRRWLQTLPLLAHFARQADCGSGQAWLNVGDMGGLPGLAFDEYRQGYHLIPDPMFMESQGYAYVKSTYASQAVPWAARRSVALWRGQTAGWHDFGGRLIQTWRDLPRVRLCQMAQTQPVLDAGFTGIVQVTDEEDREAIRRSGLLREPVSWPEFQRYKYQIDIGGNTNSWDGPFRKLCTGSPVLKVQTPLGFRQWYYDRLVAWRHFVPVAVDMSDLMEKIAWLGTHDDEARQIGENGRRLALSMSECAEVVGATATIRRALSRQ